MADLTPEQSAYFERAKRVFGSGRFSEVIEDARGELVKRNARGGIVRGDARVIGFIPNEQGQSKEKA